MGIGMPSELDCVIIEQDFNAKVAAADNPVV